MEKEATGLQKDAKTYLDAMRSEFPVVRSRMAGAVQQGNS
jgi:hypothetical protein